MLIAIPSPVLYCFRQTYMSDERTTRTDKQDDILCLPLGCWRSDSPVCNSSATVVVVEGDCVITGVVQCHISVGTRSYIDHRWRLRGRRKQIFRPRESPSLEPVTKVSLGDMLRDFEADEDSFLEKKELRL